MSAVLVDTSVWSLAFRRKTHVSSAQANLLRELIEQGDTIYTTGIIIQELLSGVRDVSQFDALLDKMTSFSVLEPRADTYIEAARLSNLCRSKGIMASSIDLLITSICIEHGVYLLTADTDFKHIQKVCDLKLAA